MGYNTVTGYGFVQSDSFEGDLFFVHRNLSREVSAKAAGGFKLHGQEIEFVADMSEEGKPLATSINLLNALPNTKGKGSKQRPSYDKGGWSATNNWGKDSTRKGEKGAGAGQGYGDNQWSKGGNKGGKNAYGWEGKGSDWGKGGESWGGDAWGAWGQKGNAWGESGKKGDAWGESGKKGDAWVASGKKGDAWGAAGKKGDAWGASGKKGDAWGASGKKGDAWGASGKKGGGKWGPY